MKRLVSVALLAAALLAGGQAMACEKHVNGHQTGSDTNSEASNK
ncbi:MAG: hypothetical protein VKO44_04215 [Cyanobacteriota bacterium]|nr:hypothetical protein [Cyanobacteriota bacterium]